MSGADFARIRARPATAGPGGATGGQREADSIKRRFKQLEGNHRDWQEQAQKDLRRQRLEIEALKRDNEQLKQHLNEQRAAEATASAAAGFNPRSFKQPKANRKSKEMEAKNETLAHIQSKINSEKARSRDVDRQIDELRGMSHAARKTMGGVNITKESHDMIGRQVTVLENRLDQSLVQFNEALRQNKDLRDQIDTLRGERDVFDAIYQKLETELQEKKKEMAFIIEVSNIAYEERDNNVQVLANLKAFAEDEMHSFAETFKELDDLLEEDRRMKEQVKAKLAADKKEKETRVADEEARQRKAKAGVSSSAQKTMQPSAQDNARDTTQNQAMMYEEAFMKIKSATDIPDLDQLVQRFLHSEEDNFSLFSYVNDLSKEIELLEKQRMELLTEVERLSLGNESDQTRRKQLKTLEEQLRMEESKNQKYLDMTSKTEGILHGVMGTVEQIFQRLDCDETNIIEQHGLTGLTTDNLLLYLASIELRTDEYLAAWSKQNGALTEGFGLPRGPQVAYDTFQVSVDPKKLPGTGEDAEGSEEEDHPLSREELIRKAQKKINAQTVAATQRANARGKGRTVGITPKK